MKKILIGLGIIGLLLISGCVQTPETFDMYSTKEKTKTMEKPILACPVVGTIMEIDTTNIELLEIDGNPRTLGEGITRVDVDPYSKITVMLKDGTNRKYIFWNPCSTYVKVTCINGVCGLIPDRKYLK